MKFYRLMLGMFLLLLVVPSKVHAQGSEPPIPPAPTNGNVVLDTLDWLTPSQESEINTINQKLDQEGIAQIAVVTLNDCGDDKQKFRNELFRTWGIGHANDNDGLLILVCWYGGDQSRRSIEQETGYGLEGTLPDILTSRIVNENFVPAFQSNRPGDGLVAMVKRYDNLLRQDIQPSSQPLDKGIAFLLIGILGLIPGVFLTVAYSTVLRMTNPIEGPTSVASAIVEDTSTGVSGWMLRLYQFALSEIIFLAPILGIFYFGLRAFTTFPPYMRMYGIFIFPYLSGWLVTLIMFYITKFSKNNNNNDGWNSGSRGRNQNGDMLNDLFDIVGDLPSFGGGDSGGGGGSKKF